MYSQNSYWCVAYLKRLSDFIVEGVLLAEGFSEESPEEISPNELAYAVLFRTVATSAPEAIVFVEASILSLTLDCEFPPEVILLESKCILRSERRAMAQLNPGDVVMHQSYIGFKRENAEAKKMAMDIIKSTLVKRRWEFWK